MATAPPPSPRDEEPRVSRHGSGERGGATTIVGVLRERAQLHPERTLFTYVDEAGAVAARLNYAGLDTRARQIAALVAEAAAPGERALLLLPHGLDFIAAF